MHRPGAHHLLLSIAFLLTTIATAQTSTNEVLNHAGFERSYHLHVPLNLPTSGRAPLVLVLHGRGGTGPGTANLTGFNEVADQHSFVVAYPTGIDNQWNYVEGIPGYNLQTPDTDFLRALVAELSARYPIDPARVYVAGFSNGGYMAQHLACKATDLFAAYASVGAAGYGGQPANCGDPDPVSILFIHGTEDAVVPFAGLTRETPNGSVTLLASVEQTFEYWAYRLRCGNEIRTSMVPNMLSPRMEIHVVDARDCAPGHELQQVVIIGGGHNWPGRPDMLPPEIAGEVNLDLDASRYIWEFFARHRK